MCVIKKVRKKRSLTYVVHKQTRTDSSSIHPLTSATRKSLDWTIKSIISKRIQIMMSKKKKKNRHLSTKTTSLSTRRRKILDPHTTDTVIFRTRNGNNVDIPCIRCAPIRLFLLFVFLFVPFDASKCVSPTTYVFVRSNTFCNGFLSIPFTRSTKRRALRYVRMCHWPTSKHVLRRYA